MFEILDSDWNGFVKTDCMFEMKWFLIKKISWSGGGGGGGVTVTGALGTATSTSAKNEIVGTFLRSL